MKAETNYEQANCCTATLGAAAVGGSSFLLPLRLKLYTSQVALLQPHLDLEALNEE
jgi:hypothetical protein